MTAVFCIVYGGFNLAPMHIWLLEVAKLCCFFNFFEWTSRNCLVWPICICIPSGSYLHMATPRPAMQIWQSWWHDVRSLQAVTLSREQTQLICASTKWDVDSQQMHSSIFQNFPWEWGGWGHTPRPPYKSALCTQHINIKRHHPHKCLTPALYFA